jgi:hypothetical protein
MSYGFRLFEVSLHNGGGHARAHFDASGDECKVHYGKYAKGIADLLIAEDNLDGWPALRVSAEDAAADLAARNEYDIESTRVRWLKAVYRPHRLSLEFRYGRVGDHDQALAARSQGDVAIGGKAPASSYRAELVMPAKGDGWAILAVETSGPQCPRETVQRWLTLMSKIRTVRDFPDTGEADRPPWWRLKLTPFADMKQISDMIEQSSQNKVVLTKSSASASGKRNVVEYTLQAPLLSTASKSSALDLARRIIRKHRNDLGEDAAPDTSDLLTLAGIDDPGSLEFNDGRLELESDGIKAKVGLTNVDEIFTYPIRQDARPNDDVWLRAVRDKLQELTLAGQFANTVEWG